MENIVLALIMAAIFVIGYYVAGRFGKFVDESCHDCQESQIQGRNVYITETAGKSKNAISNEVTSMLDTLPDHDEYDIIICRTVSEGIIEYLERSGCSIKYHTDNR